MLLRPPSLPVHKGVMTAATWDPYLGLESQSLLSPAWPLTAHVPISQCNAALLLSRNAKQTGSISNSTSRLITCA